MKIKTKGINKLAIGNFTNRSDYYKNIRKMPADALALVQADEPLQWRTAYTGDKTRLEHFTMKSELDSPWDTFAPLEPKICTLPSNWKLVYVVYNFGDNVKEYTNAEIIPRSLIVQGGEGKYITFYINNNNVLFAQSQNCWCYIYKVYYLL